VNAHHPRLKGNLPFRRVVKSPVKAIRIQMSAHDHINRPRKRVIEHHIWAFVAERICAFLAMMPRSTIAKEPLPKGPIGRNILAISFFPGTYAC